MAGGVNKVLLLGHVGADPEIRDTKNGTKMATFRVATSESFKDKVTGDRKEITEWHSVVVFNEALVKVVEQYVKKGSKVYVEGAQKTRKWQNKSGADKYVTETVLGPFHSSITLLDKAESNRPDAPADDSDYGTAKTGGADIKPNDPDDDIPF